MTRKDWWFLLVQGTWLVLLGHFLIGYTWNMGSWVEIGVDNEGASDVMGNSPRHLAAWIAVTGWIQVVIGWYNLRRRDWS